MLCAWTSKEASEEKDFNKCICRLLARRVIRNLLYGVILAGKTAGMLHFYISAFEEIYARGELLKIFFFLKKNVNSLEYDGFRNIFQLPESFNIEIFLIPILETRRFLIQGQFW